MAKYVIELDDEPCMRENGYNFYTCKTVPWWSISDMIINRLTPYTEPDLNPLVDEAVETIENEVWNLAREIAYHMSFKECVDAGMLSDDDIYNDASGVLEKLTYQEAKAKYEEWEKGNFRVGDEVIYNSRKKAVVLIPETKEKYGTILTEDLVTNAVSHVELAKTGRHFDDIEELIKKMKETE